MFKHLILSFLTPLLIPFLALALPNQINQQGLALDAAGDPIQGRHEVRVRLWREAAGGAAFFDEVHPNIEFREGYYSIAIGSVGVLEPQMMLGEVYLSISVGGGADFQPRTRLLKVPGAMVAEVALGIEGNLDLDSLSIGGVEVINSEGLWVGAPGSLQGPPGPAGPQGPAGLGGDSDTPEEIRVKLLEVDGSGSGIDADRLDSIDSSEFFRTPAQILAALVQVDGAGSGLDADRLDGIDSSEFIHTAVQIREKLKEVDGSGSGVDTDRLDGLDSGDFLRADGSIIVDGEMSLEGLLNLYHNAGAPAVCDASEMGALYYDSNLGAFVGCTGTEWHVFGSGSGGGDGGGGGGGGEIICGDGGDSPRDADGEATIPQIPIVGVSPYFADDRLSPDVWTNIPGREYSFTKAASSTTLRVNYQDVLGYDMSSENLACEWRLTINGVAARSFAGHSSKALGLRLWPTSLEWYLEGQRAGDHTLRIQVKKGPGAAQCLAGWTDGDAENSISVEEIDSHRLGIVQHMGESQTTSTAWVTVPGRTLIYAKQDHQTLIKVSYMDNLGSYMNSANYLCSWRLVMDGVVVGRFANSHGVSTKGWRIHPRHLAWLVDGVAVGQHTFEIQVIKATTGASQCLSGWPNGTVANSLVVQEVDGTHIAIKRDLADASTTPDSWTYLPGRDLSHTKAKAETQVRVTYMDTMGTNMVTRGWGCRWQLVVGSTVHGRPYNTYNSNAAGWRNDPTHMQWIVDGLAVGAHRYRIQVIRPESGATSHCRGGLNSPQNFLMIEEIQ